MTLLEGRVLGSVGISQLVLWLIDQGYEVAYGEGADFITAKDQTSDHMVPGLHGLGLAWDLALYMDGVYLTDTEDYRDAGEKWESMNPAFHWGGHFSDGNHFSCSDPSIPGCVTTDGRLRK